MSVRSSCNRDSSSGSAALTLVSEVVDSTFSLNTSDTILASSLIDLVTDRDRDLALVGDCDLDLLLLVYDCVLERLRDLDLKSKS